MSIRLYIIDALGPFVDDNNPPFNWSRAPLYDFEDINSKNILTAKTGVRLI
jgi:hypothetical protein